MKILQLVPYYIPYRGGQELYIHNLSKYLVKTGIEVDVHTSNFPSNCNHEKIDGINIYRHKCIARPLRNPITPELLKLGKKIEQYDLIHTHNEHSFAALAATYYKSKYKIPLVITCHGQLTFGDYFKDIIEKYYTIFLGKKIFDLCDSIVVNSKDDKDYILSLNSSYDEKIQVLHNAIDPTSFESVSPNSEYSNPDSKIKILFVGRMIKRKGVEWLIKAIKLAIEEYQKKEIFCIFVGEGEDCNYFNYMVKTKNLDNFIHFAGNVSNDELITFYKTSDIFVLPSLSEVCPTVVLEAMYTGLPVITTDIPGIRDHFSEYAILVPPRDPESLAKGIIDLINNRELRDKLSNKGKKYIENKYTWDKVVKEYENIYLRIMGEF